MKWQEPPGDIGNRGQNIQKWAKEAAALRENIGLWAVIAEYPKGPDNTAGRGEYYTRAGNLARNIKRGSLNAFQPAGAFESTVRTEDKFIRVYARYVGEKEASP